MSPDVEQPVPRDVHPVPDLDPPRSRTAPHAATLDDAAEPLPAPDDDHAGPVPHGSHHILRDSPEDRWRWRARIRQSPHQLRVYRFGVGIVGTLLVVLGFVTGPLPGPGGIPLVLLGLAVMASEFVWAERLMAVFKAQLHRFRSWSRARQTAAFLVFIAGCGLVGYAYLLTLGPPTWLPSQVDGLLARLPGL
ncbi:PGPGW domain-containing protein [Microlunatus capsulatus]|uniref:Uncharacterized protein (TIGR02611 family) n=1 Tax=Microlunatus capsulatus TaxID=99117 RepID=A0ABS4Z3A0_9ACTN|nr:PGPGW domain-containing protein [Microlunatus capsulatus]MBP2415275.1 uncharacterized protein (TIGR02611 family) [Microlunatus capsulatus]